MENQLTPQAYGKNLYVEYLNMGVATRENICRSGETHGFTEPFSIWEIEKIAGWFAGAATEWTDSLPGWYTYKREYKILGMLIATIQYLDFKYKKDEANFDVYFQEKLQLYWKQVLRGSFRALTGTKAVPEIDATVPAQLFNYLELMALIVQYRLTGDTYASGNDEALRSRAKIAVSIRDVTVRIKTELSAAQQELSNESVIYPNIMPVINEIASKFSSPGDAHNNELLDPMKTARVYYFWFYAL